MAIQKTASRDSNKSSKRKLTKYLFRSLIVICILCLIGFCLFFWIVRSLGNIALAELGRLTGTEVFADSVKSKLDGSVEIDFLEVRPDQERLYDDSIIKAKTVYAKFDLFSILLLGPKLDKLSVSDFIINVQFDADNGRWNW